MSNERSSAIDRRRLLRLGTLLGALVAGGCGGGDEAQTVTTPPVKGGNRAFLDNSEKDARLPGTTTAEPGTTTKKR
jgi:hypothetical protein